MTINKDFVFFAPHTEWYRTDKEKGYVPTPDAPEEIVKAIDNFNKYLDFLEKNHMLGVI